MLAWSCLAVLAVATAAPQTQVIRTRVPINYQTVQTVNSDYQPIQTINSDFQTISSDYPYQTVQAVHQPYQTVRTLSHPVETVQTVQQPYQIRTVSQPQYVTSHQFVDGNAYSGIYQPTVRVAPAKTLKKAVIKTAVVQPIQSTVSPVTVQQVTPQVVPQQIVRVAPKQRVGVVQQQVVVPNQVQVNYQQRLAAGQQYYQNYQGYQGVDPVAPQGLAILRQVNDVQDDGSYAYAFETENGIKVQEEGRAVADSSVVQGSYTYQAPDGTPITVNYVADENGFRAEGDHIPKASPEIARAVEYLRSLPPRPEDSEGQYHPDANGY